ncbi:alpha/beta hydrolase [Streptomyces sp. NA04227]|uniref:alpha/beta hydrolase family protein n=1 Tax=Streptomyces sp. NA04227 TaxID=2742136 RepID=UPI0015925F10|nr:alpha/beta hydrolase [Streptomyces sp. NA04227]QKW07455.1 alpha/beta hydrolase [Streptomyces sp. NA04227]
MPDAAALDAAEERSAFSHPPVAPDATAAYGEHPDQIVDFYAPRGTRAGAERVPLVAAFHGGAWRAPYDRKHFSPFAAFLAGRGLAVASVEYRRGGDPVPGVEGPVAGRWPDTFDDVAAALEALPGLVRTALPQADPRRTVLTGHSAGGQLALWGAARHVLPESSPWRRATDPALRGVVALAPIADFELAGKLGVCGGAVGQLLGGAGQLADRRAQADPYALHPTGIATTLVQGREDTVVPAAIAESYAEATALAGEPVGLTLLDGVGHFALIDPAADACAVAAEEIAQLAW